MPQLQTAGLAKRLAEAADSFRDGKYYYFVSLLNPTDDYPDFDLHSVSGNTDEQANNNADTLKNSLGSDYFKFGPYKNDSEESPLLDFDSLEVKLIKNGLATSTITLDKSTDAIILSSSAYDKFFLPYYTRLYGVDVAASFRSQATTALASGKTVYHSDGTAHKIYVSV
jgi:hypothetical protein